MLLAVLSAIAAGAFLLTQWAARETRHRQALDGAAWFERGRAELSGGRTALAVRAFGRAVARRPDEWTYASGLAHALVADQQLAAARRVLLQWRDRRSEDGSINVELARVEVAAGDVAAAVRYYEDALQGRWPDGTSLSRVDIRRELIRYQLRQGLTAAALAQTLVLAANVPDESAALIEVGRLFRSAGDARRALDRFSRALRLEPGNLEARTAGAEAAFSLGDYARVLGYARGLTDAGTTERARVAAAVIAADPLESRLSFAERERRLSAMIDFASDQLAACRQRAPTATPLAEKSAQGLADALAVFTVGLSPARLRESSDVLERGVLLAGQAIEVVRERCPPLGVRAEAVARVARRHGAAE